MLPIDAHFPETKTCSFVCSILNLQRYTSPLDEKGEKGWIHEHLEKEQGEEDISVQICEGTKKWHSLSVATNLSIFWIFYFVDTLRYLWIVLAACCRFEMVTTSSPASLSLLCRSNWHINTIKKNSANGFNNYNNNKSVLTVFNIKTFVLVFN